MKSLFLRACSQNIDIINPKLGQKGPKLVISCTKGDRKMKFNSKGKFDVKYSFLKPLSQTFEVLTACDVINPKMSEKGPSWYFMYQR